MIFFSFFRLVFSKIEVATKRCIVILFCPSLKLSLSVVFYLFVLFSFFFRLSWREGKNAFIIFLLYPCVLRGWAIEVEGGFHPLNMFMILDVPLLKIKLLFGALPDSQCNIPTLSVWNSNVISRLYPKKKLYQKLVKR